MGFSIQDSQISGLAAQKVRATRKRLVNAPGTDPCDRNIKTIIPNYNARTL